MQLLKRILPPLAALCLLSAVSCGGGVAFSHVHARSVAEAEILRAEAAANNITGDDILAANALLDGASAVSAKPKDAIGDADRAAEIYRTALARHSLEQSAKALAEAEAALGAIQEQLDKYSQILEGLGSRRRGDN